MTDDAQSHAPDEPPAAVRVPVTDRRHQVQMTWIMRGPWAELLGPGAEVTITHRDAQ